MSCITVGLRFEIQTSLRTGKVRIVWYGVLRSDRPGRVSQLRRREILNQDRPDSSCIRPCADLPMPCAVLHSCGVYVINRCISVRASRIYGSNLRALSLGQLKYPVRFNLRVCVSFSWKYFQRRYALFRVRYRDISSSGTLCRGF